MADLQNARALLTDRIEQFSRRNETKADQSLPHWAARRELVLPQFIALAVEWQGPTRGTKQIQRSGAVCARTNAESICFEVCFANEKVRGVRDWLPPREPYVLILMRLTAADPFGTLSHTHNLLGNPRTNSRRSPSRFRCTWIERVLHRRDATPESALSVTPGVVLLRLSQTTGSTSSALDDNRPLAKMALQLRHFPIAHHTLTTPKKTRPASYAWIEWVRATLSFTSTDFGRETAFCPTDFINSHEWCERVEHQYLAYRLTGHYSKLGNVRIAHDTA